MPGWLEETRELSEIAPGCYRVDSAGWFPFHWIAANDLPLKDELLPFLLARSGRALEEFAQWVSHRQPLDWMYAMVKYTSMSTTMRKEWLELIARQEEDPEVESRRQEILRSLLDNSPKVKQQLIDQGIEKGQLGEARAALGRVLALRRFMLSSDEEARVAECADVATLQRWHDQAVTAATAAEALQ